MSRTSTIAVGIVSLVLFLTVVQPAQAIARRRVGSVTAPSSGSKPATTGGGVGIFAKLRPDRRAIIMTITNLNQAQNVSYLFTYTTSGKGEGSQGTIKSNEGAGTARELLFGTCSTGVCTYHAGITNAVLEVRAKLNSGKTLIKRFRIRV